MEDVVQDDPKAWRDFQQKLANWCNSLEALSMSSKALSDYLQDMKEHSLKEKHMAASVQQCIITVSLFHQLSTEMNREVIRSVRAPLLGVVEGEGRSKRASLQLIPLDHSAQQMEKSTDTVFSSLTYLLLSFREFFFSGHAEMESMHDAIQELCNRHKKMRLEAESDGLFEQEYTPGEKALLLPSDIVHQGMLVKQGNYFRNWKERWFVLKHGYLLYFAGQMDRMLKGAIPLRRASVEESSKKAFAFTITTPTRTWFICAKSAEGRATWLQRIKECIPVAKKAKATSFGLQAQIQRVRDQGPPLSPTFVSARSADANALKSSGDGKKSGEAEFLKRSTEHNKRRSCEPSHRSPLGDSSQRQVSEKRLSSYIPSSGLTDSSHKSEDKRKSNDTQSEITADTQPGAFSQPDRSIRFVTDEIRPTPDASAGIDLSVSTYNHPPDSRDVPDIAPEPKQHPVPSKALQISSTENIKSSSDEVPPSDELMGRASQSAKAGSVNKQGWLKKKGKNRKNWTQRYFILRENCLLYFRSIEADRPAGIIVLRKADVVVGEPKPHQFNINTPLRTYQICASSDEERASWMSHIKRAVLNE
eukprot:CAMPEP_0177662564 /NCGR_PEP_ID=MMETSP0447-20121125/19374_1 /TAXON_ID=0 /ORGANISM="Stygamoeba regulata, Strain BSH-02190019" /LENGTH=588 /DNA_ID=CAMNT_0019168171 /DNA_START=112 /DNA_END=1878 /DNA_ORIENTATION=+